MKNRYTIWNFEASPYPFFVCSVYERTGPTFTKHFIISLN